jgi:hypothetical protein
LTYEELYFEYPYLNIKEMDLSEVKNLKGLCIDGNIAIHSYIPTQKEKACILAEELGHYYTTSGNILDQSKITNRKQELKARMWAYDKMIGLNGIIEAYKAGCQNVAEAADYLNVTEEFFFNAIEAYRHKYGISTNIDNYIIYFEPSLIVAEL